MSDWTTEATDLVERTVGMVRDRTVEPARAIARGLVYGLVATLIAVPAVVLLAIGLALAMLALALYVRDGLQPST